MNWNASDSDSDDSPFSSNLTTPVDESVQPFNQIVVQHASACVQDESEIISCPEDTTSSKRKVLSLSRGILKAKTLAGSLKKSLTSLKVNNTIHILLGSNLKL